MRLKIAYGLVFCLIVLCVNCGGGLSRSAAADMISKKMAEGDVKSDGATFIGFNREEFDRQPQPALLFRLGYVDCRDHNTYDCKVMLTDKAPDDTKVEYWPISNSISTVAFPVAQAELIEVTGVTEKDNDATATFTWRYKPINDLGEAFGYGKQIEGTAQFQKFDDGWRLMKY